MVVKRHHVMPFGTTIGDHGATTFSLWAPAARSIRLRLESQSGRSEWPMEPKPGGWHSHTNNTARASDRYSFVIDDSQAVPDPASRLQPQDVHGPSTIVDPQAFQWTDGDWRGRPWEEAVIYEIHVGTFTPEGTYAGATEKLDALASLGVTAIELMPLAESPGAHNWGYDGVYLFAPEARYGTPDDLKRFVCAAHARNLMVFLDVVYNHFGPEGNYLHICAPQFFSERHHTPWGAAINFDDASGRVVRDFYVHNALYWLDEFNFDGLRFDAVHAIVDDSQPHILTEIAVSVRQQFPNRHVHLVLENDDNAAWPLTRDASGTASAYVAQWNDDVHHALHVLTTGETQGYYADYAADPGKSLARALAEGFSYQGEVSQHRDGKRRGEPSGHLPTTAFVSFLQNHDQIGNRPFGDRINALAPADAVRAAAFVYLLAPSVPLLFMGEEWAAEQPFRFFCDFEPDLAARVREGRRSEFSHFFQTAETTSPNIPDATNPAAFEACILHWQDRAQSPHAQVLDCYRQLLAIRHQAVIPRLHGTRAVRSDVFGPARRAIAAEWRMGDGATLWLLANLDRQEVPAELPADPDTLLIATDPRSASTRHSAILPPWFAGWWLRRTQ